jgi:DsbC/DsbD-like thiol-disulfide interchange protein
MTVRIATFALASFVLAATATAQSPVKWTATAASDSAAPGAKTSVTLLASIGEGWHIYSLTQGPGGPMPSRITLPTGQPFSIDGKIKASAPDVKLDQNFGIQVETYENKAEFTVPIKVKKSAKAGPQKVQISTRYQVCNASMCLPPRTDMVTVDMGVTKNQ